MSKDKKLKYRKITLFSSGGDVDFIDGLINILGVSNLDKDVHLVLLI